MTVVSPVNFQQSRSARADQARASQKYTANPSRCANCSHYVPPVQRTQGPGMSPPVCNAGHFAVKPHGICEIWRGVNGEALRRP